MQLVRGPWPQMLNAALSVSLPVAALVAGADSVHTPQKVAALSIRERGRIGLRSLKPVDERFVEFLMRRLCA